MKKISIINVYGYENIGDGAILDEAVKTISELFAEDIEFSIHTSNFGEISSTNNYKYIFLNPYGIAIKGNKKINNILKLIRFIKIFFVSYVLIYLSKVYPNILPKKGDYSYLYSLKKSDYIFSVGGGYLRTKNKFLDSFGFLLTILSIRMVHDFKKKIIFLPMSFGNFASKIQEDIAINSIKDDTIIVRDLISLNRFKKRNIVASFFPDLALMSEPLPENKREDYIVLTARKWLKDDKQMRFENALSRFVDYVWEQYKLKTVFIPMVWNEKEDNDEEVGKRIKENLKNNDILKILHVRSAIDATKIISNAKYAVCTRMHSAIFAINTKTPFIAIAYEDKTWGIAEIIGFRKWVIDINDVDLQISPKFDFLVKDFQSFDINIREIKDSRVYLIEFLKKLIN